MTYDQRFMTLELRASEQASWLQRLEDMVFEHTWKTPI